MTRQPVNAALKSTIMGFGGSSVSGPRGKVRIILRNLPRDPLEVKSFTSLFLVDRSSEEHDNRSLSAYVGSSIIPRHAKEGKSGWFLGSLTSALYLPSPRSFFFHLSVSFFVPFSSFLSFLPPPPFSLPLSLIRAPFKSVSENVARGIGRRSGFAFVCKKISSQGSWLHRW